MDARSWKSWAQDAKWKIANNEIAVGREVFRLVQAINGMSAFVTIGSCLPHEGYDYFSVGISVIPTEAGWSALARLVQIIDDYNGDCDYVHLWPEVIHGDQPFLYFDLVVDGGHIDQFSVQVSSGMTAGRV